MGDLIDANINLIQTAMGHVAAEGLERVGKGPLGVVINPATWAYNFATKGATPNSVDYAFWAISLGGSILAPAALVAQYFKGMIDDDVQRKLVEVRSTEPKRCALGIAAIGGWGTPASLAGEFARAGGVAWMHPNGLWVSIVDGRKRLIANYRPRRYAAIRRPVWPLKMAPNRSGFMVTDKINF